MFFFSYKSFSVCRLIKLAGVEKPSAYLEFLEKKSAEAKSDEGVSNFTGLYSSPQIDLSCFCFTEINEQH
jgi:hypothetical protein